MIVDYADIYRLYGEELIYEECVWYIWRKCIKKVYEESIWRK